MDYISGATVSPDKISWLEIYLSKIPGDALDLGCGAGLYCNWLAQQRWKVAGLDLQPPDNPILETGVKITAHDLEKGIPYADKSLDVVLVWDILEHLEQEEAVWKEIGRILKPGGRIIGSVPHSGDQGLYPYNLAFKHRIDKTHQREYHPKDLCDRMRMYGFKVLGIELKGPVSPQMISEFVAMKSLRPLVRKSVGLLRRIGFLKFGEYYADVFFAGEKVLSSEY